MTLPCSWCLSLSVCFFVYNFVLLLKEDKEKQLHIILYTPSLLVVLYIFLFAYFVYLNDNNNFFVFDSFVIQTLYFPFARHQSLSNSPELPVTIFYMFIDSFYLLFYSINISSVQFRLYGTTIYLRSYDYDHFN